jgi:hypothetical protein
MKHIINITVLVAVFFAAGIGGGIVGLVFYTVLNWIS